MIKLYRVFPYDSSAAPTERGGALFVPDPADGRIANPDLYRELYLAASPQAAVAERFGRFARWRKETFRSVSGLPYALARFDLKENARICDLDERAMLEAYDIAHPSDVVTPRRRVTQNWARRVFESSRWDGISWWSHYYSVYRIFGIWAVDLLSAPSAPEVLTVDSAEVAQTAIEIVRQRERR